MMKNIRKIFGIAVAVLGFAFASNVYAFTVSPAIVDLKLAPGETHLEILHVMNSTNDAQSYVLSEQNFIPKGEEGQQDFLPESDTSGLAGWIQPREHVVTMAAHETKDVLVDVKLPRDAEPGGHYAALFFSNQGSSKTETASVGITAKTGILFLVNVTGMTKEDARVESFGLVGEGSLRSLPATFELRVRNLGNVHFQPAGSVVIKNIFGMESARIPLNPGRTSVLPNSVRRIDTAWIGDYGGHGTGFFSAVQREWSGFAIGRYTAEIDGTYGAGHEPLSGQVRFWIWPWHLMLILAVGLFVLVSLIKAYNRMLVSRLVRSSSKKK